MTLTASPTKEVLAAPGAWSAQPASALSDAEIDAAARKLLGPGTGTGSAGAPRLLSRLLDPALEMDELSQRLQAEPGLAVRVLRVANSPFYGQSGRVDSLARAAGVLGLQSLRGIVAAACFDRLVVPTGHVGPDPAELRRHSLAVACAAQAVAQRLAPELADQAFVVGLLHDLGLLLRSALQDQGEWQDTDHARCGRRLLMAWQLPAGLGHAVAVHHDFPRKDDDCAMNLAQLLALGEHLATAAGHTLAGEPAALLTIQPELQATLQQADATWPLQMQRLSAAMGD